MYFVLNKFILTFSNIKYTLKKLKNVKQISIFGIRKNKHFLFNFYKYKKQKKKS